MKRNISLVALVILIGCGRDVVTLSGPKGDTGPVGAAGTPGTDAIPVTAVQFCTGYQTTYPATFPEYGFCLGGRLFANYWDGHNSWLAEVVPGYYASTSTTAPCNFTVGANCTISQFHE